MLILSHFRSFFYWFLSNFIDHFHNIFRSSKSRPWLSFIIVRKYGKMWSHLVSLMYYFWFTIFLLFFSSECAILPVEKSDLFNRAARTSDVWTKSDCMPFIVEPEFGELQPDESINITVTFSPLNVFVYQMKLVCM